VTPNFSTYKQFWKDKKIRRKQNCFAKRSLADSVLNMGKYGYRSKPLTDIEFKDAVVDVLHLLLRVMDKLEKNLINSIIEAGTVF
jgi:hypothetical protein